MRPITTLMRRSVRAAVLGSALLFPAVQPLAAQDAKPNPNKSGDIFVRAPRIDLPLIWQLSADRPVLGVTLGASTRSDTAGVRIEDVEANGPAAKAGLKAGDVITEVNGVSLRVAAADAEDLALAGVAQRRLQRTLAKAKPGDEVDLRVRSGATTRALKVKTVSARELEAGRESRAPRITTLRDDSHPAIGLSIGASGSVRDTLGLFVSSVIGGGPAEKAGVIEGERVAAVNGVDVRVPKEDVEDGSAASVRVTRFVREVQKVAAGTALTLRVYGNGRYREVTVTPVKSADLPSDGWQMMSGDGFQILRGGNFPAIEQLRGRLDGAVVRVRTGLTKM